MPALEKDSPGHGRLTQRKLPRTHAEAAEHAEATLNRKGEETTRSIKLAD